MKAVKRFVLIIVMACPLFATADWVEQRLTLEWRNWLTSYLLRAYFADRAFFKLKQQAGSLDNPDQVLCEIRCKIKQSHWSVTAHCFKQDL